MSSKPPVSRVPTPPCRQKGQNNAYPTTGIGHSSPNRPLTPNQNHTNVDPSSGTVTAGGSERVKVVVRVRPPLRVEEEGGAVTSVEDDPTKLQLHRPAAQVQQSEHTYDVVLPPESTQQDVYVAAVKDVVEDVMNGYNGTVMAYGQTGAGKTHTLGNIEPNAIGMIPRAVAEIFKQADDDRINVYTVGMSYIQIYMELIQDLLKPDADNLQIREDSAGVFVAGAHEVKVSSMEQCLHYLELGEQNRAFAFTHLNAHSSRSHAVVMLTVTKRARHVSARESAEMKALVKDGVTPQKVKVGKLFLVDLAGSERLKKSKSVGIRATEAISINLSLTTLGMCINARATDSPHVPFRDSKLTRLLQESLGGNAKTSLIICVANVKAHVDESLMSLQFASRAMCVRNKPRVNERIDYKALQDELLAELNSDKSNEKRREITAELYRQDYEVLQKERDQYRQIAEALTKENEEEEARRLRILEKKEQELRAQQEELQRQQAQLEEHRQQQHLMTQTLQEIKRERDQYLKRSETVNKEREEERRNLLHAKEQELNAQASKVQLWQQQLEDAQRAHASLERQVKQLTEERDSLQEQNQELRGHLKSSVAVAEQLQARVENVQQDGRRQLAQEREQATAAFAAARRQQEEVAAKHEEDLLGLVVKHGAEMQAAQDKHSAEVQQLKAQLAQAAQARAEEGRERAAAHSSELAGLRAKMEGVIASLRRDLASAKEGHAKEEASMWDQHKSEVEGLQAQHAREVEGLQAQHVREVEGLQAQHVREVEGLQVQHAREVEKLRAHLSNTQQEHAQRVRQLQQEREATHSDLVDRHDDELRSLQAQHQQQAAELQGRICQLADSERALQAETATLTTTVRGLHAEREAQDGRLQQREEQLQASRQHSAQLQAAMLDLQAHSSQLLSAAEQRFMQALSHRTRHLDTLQRQVGKLRAPLASLQQQRSQLLATRVTLTRHTEELGAAAASLESALASRSREADALAGELAESRREAEQLKAELEDLGLEADSKEEDNEGLREQVEGLQEEGAQLRAQLQGSQQRCAELKRQLEKFTADRASALQHRTTLRQKNHAASVIQRAWRLHCKDRLVSNLNQGEMKLDMANQRVNKLEQHSRSLQQVQQQTHVTLGLNLIQTSMNSFRDGVETIMATFMLPKKELQARLNAQARIQNLSPMGSNGGFNAVSPGRGSLTPRRNSASSANGATPRTPNSQRMPLSPLSSHLARFTQSPSLRRLSNGSNYSREQ